MDAKPAIIHTTTKRHAAEQNTYTPFVQHHVLIGQRYCRIGTLPPRLHLFVDFNARCQCLVKPPAIGEGGPVFRFKVRLAKFVPVNGSWTFYRI